MHTLLRRALARALLTFGVALATVPGGAMASGTTPATYQDLANLWSTFGGGVQFNLATGTYTPPSYLIQGTYYSNVGDAMTALNTAVSQQYAFRYSPSLSGPGTFTMCGTSCNMYQSTTQLSQAPGSVVIGDGTTNTGGGIAILGNNIGGGSALNGTIDAVSSGVVVGGSSGAGLTNSPNSTAINGFVTNTTNGVAINGSAISGVVPGTSSPGGNGAVAINGTAAGNGIGIGMGAYAVLNGIAIGANANTKATDPYYGGTGVAGMMAIGTNAAAQNSGMAIGNGTTNYAFQGVTIGPNAFNDITAANSIVVGANARTQTGASNSGALGSGSVADLPNQMSIGAIGAERTLANMAPGVRGTDGVNVNQVSSVVGGLGGGASFQNGTFTAPSYALSGGTYTNVGSALAYLDSKPSGGANPLAVLYDGPVKTDITLSGTQIHALNAGAAYSDAVNVGQVAPIANSLGGGASFQNGQWVGPSYALTGGVFHDDNSALQYLDNRISGISTGGGGYDPTAVHYDAGSNSGSITLQGGAQGTRISNVQAGNLGSSSTDAVNGAQLGDLGRSANAVFGGHGNFDLATGTFTNVNFNAYSAISGHIESYSTVYDAIFGLGQSIQALNNQGGGGPDPTAVHYDAGTNDTSVTLQGQGGTQIHNVAAGTASTDAANVGQVQQAQQTAIDTSNQYTNEQVNQAIKTAKMYTDATAQQTLNTARSYTDQRAAETLHSAKAYTDWKFNQLNDRFNRISAMGQATAQMVATFGGADPANHNRIAAGLGMAGGVSALSVGYQHTSESGHVAWNVGGSISGRERSVGAGVGYSW